MRFMMFVKANADSEAGRMPSQALIGEMMRFNEELVKAGVLLDGAGLHPSAKGVRRKFTAGGSTLVEGPFPETRQLVAGYWIIQTKTREEAIAWLERVPAPHEGEAEIELRQFFELEDFEPGPGIDHARRLEAELKNKA